MTKNLKDIIRVHVKHILSTMDTRSINISIQKLDKRSEYNSLSTDELIRYSEYIICNHCKNYLKGYSDDIIEKHIKKIEKYLNEKIYNRYTSDEWLKFDHNPKLDHKRDICKRCNGTGYLHQYNYVEDGTCYTCKGKGYIEYLE